MHFPRLKRPKTRIEPLSAEVAAMIKPKPGDKWIAWLTGLFCIALGVMMLVLTPDFVTRGVSAKARVVEVTVDRSPRGRYYYNPRYDLISHPDAPTCEDAWGFWRWTAPEIGDIVNVVYVKESSTKFHCIKDSMLHRWGFPVFAIGFGILMIKNRMLRR